MRRTIACLLIALAALPLGARAAELTVSAAASLTNAFKDLAGRFEHGHPGTTLRLNFGASGTLLQQMVHGAPVDVFASADQETMDKAAAQGLIDTATRRDFAGNGLVLIVPLQGGPPPASLQDLAAAPVRRIAVGKTATVPAGRYTRQALEAAGLWDALQPKFVPADSVRQVLDYVARGEVDAGFVYRTDAAVMRDRARTALTVAGHAPISYPVAVAADSRQPALARQFLEFLASAPARGILDRYGFGTP